MDALRRGVDVVVGTPGRVMDLLDRKRLIGDKVRNQLGCQCVLPECLGCGGRCRHRQQHEQQQADAAGACGVDRRLARLADTPGGRLAVLSVWSHCSHSSPTWLLLWLLSAVGWRVCVCVYGCAQVRFVVLDEADQMLDMGFQEDMEVILQQVCSEMRL